MSRWLNLLVICSVLWCGLHVMEPAGMASSMNYEASADALGGCPDRDDDSGHAANAGHHHCPVTAELPSAGAEGAFVSHKRMFFAGLSGALPSLAQAPPLEPPTA
ncbi:MAG: hypothetical protein ABIQ81_08870 [Novosphingobium sp.]